MQSGIDMCFLHGYSRSCANKQDPPPLLRTRAERCCDFQRLTNTRGETPPTGPLLGEPIHHFWGKMDLLFTVTGDIFLHHTQIHLCSLMLFNPGLLTSPQMHYLCVWQPWPCQGSGEVNHRCLCEHHLQSYHNFILKETKQNI